MRPRKTLIPESAELFLPVWGERRVFIETMNLIFTIEYYTRRGECPMLCLEGRRMVMRSADGRLWQTEIASEELCPGGMLPPKTEYRYEIETDGAVTRCEWRGHELRLPTGESCDAVRLCDRWQPIPDDASFYSSAFTQAIFARPNVEAPVEPQGANAELCVAYPALRPGELLALAGEGFPGGWECPVVLDESDFPVWRLSLKIAAPFAWKFVVVERRTHAIVRWEEGPNRMWDAIPAAGERIVESRPVPRFEACRWRGAGTAVPVFSLRSEAGLGIGEFADLKLLADWAAATGQRVIQVLPVNDTTMTGTWMDSYPYNANSSFALHPQYIRLTEVGVVEDEAYRRLRDALNALPEVDYERVNAAKQRLLREAYGRLGSATAESSEYREFVAENRSWLLPYAAYCTLRDRFGTADFTRWGRWSRYDDAAIEDFCREHAAEVGYPIFVQYHLHRQLAEASRYARARGVVLKGDLPIGVSRTSADAWQSPHLFHLDAQAGAPPDAFSAFGQNWGFPTYDWERMALDDYAWWRARLTRMAAYFDAYRIDHILGFFRIWEIPTHAVHGLLGYFNPALPYTAEELRTAGFDPEKYTRPVADETLSEELFGDLAQEVRACCFAGEELRPEYAEQRLVAEHFPGDDERSVRLREGLLRLLDDVLLVEDPRRKGYFHPRIAGRDTYMYRKLDDARRAAFERLHDDFFYRRHDRFWQASAERKLPALLAASRMLACGEDLGMIPGCVPETMARLQILSLEIQRMPKTFGEAFADPARYPYLSVCTTSTHDMTPLRAWWEEDRDVTRRFYREVLGGEGEPAAVCDAATCRRIVTAHLDSPAMLAILPLQDWLAVDARLRFADPSRERINVPAIARYHWRYRMHLTLEQLLAERPFAEELLGMIRRSGRA